MEMTAKVTIRGAKAFKGNIDGKDLDSGKIYVDTELKGENSWGVCTQELRCEGGDMVRSIKHNPFPFIAEIGLQEMSNGKETTKVVTSIKPLLRVDESAASKGAKAA
jgi:hypothetical protein